jgi:ADP-ribose pyrophosphatase YjhB (NUDIX family)
MIIKIFFEEKEIYLADELPKDLRSLSEQPGVLFENEPAHLDASLIIEALKDDVSAAVLISKDIKNLKKLFFYGLNIIEAAGGIVQNTDKEILFIFRRGKWDLPKGKMEQGESEEVCAAREIEEETGVTGLTLKKKTGETYHIYREKRQNILKISHWFYFTSNDTQTLKPQLEEDITEVKWFKTADIKIPMKNTFESIKDIMRTFFDAP